MMETDWGVAAGGEDPVIELPWQDAATTRHFEDLRVSRPEQEARIASLPEVAGAPALAVALVEWNAPRGLLMTSKCDLWSMDAEELATLAEVLDMPVQQHGFACYIDVLLVREVPRADFLLHEEWARGAAVVCAALPHPEARLDLVIRPSRVEEVWGYGVSVYLFAGGADMPQAKRAWAAALTGCVPLIRAAAEATMAPPESLSPGSLQ
jgi:hypothetical protein